jgi:imidazolonepropionase-like amidohydrolase
VTGVALTGGRLVDGCGGPPVDGAAVLIDGERITWAGRAADAVIPDGFRRIDTTGQTILPGLIDAHAHVAAVMGGAELQTQDTGGFASFFIGQFIRSGVTTVRDTGSPDTGPEFQLLREGRRDWPRFVGSGPNLDGSPGGPWPGLRVVDDPQLARSAVRELAARGVDFVKTYVWMPPATLAAVVAAAHAAGLPVAAHAGHILTAGEAVRLGVDALEHVRIGPELLSEEKRAALKALRTRDYDWLFDFRAWRFADLAGAETDRLIQLLLDRRIFLTPTLSVARAVLMGDDEAITAPPGIGAFPDEVREQWHAEAFTLDWEAEDFGWGRIELERQMQFVGLAARAGVRVVAGTDTPNPFVLPGQSMGDELELLVGSGLTPMQAIMAGTSRAAELLGLADRIGAVKPGYYADLAIVRGDPVSDITATRSVSLVIKSGQVVFAERPSDDGAS